jgi:hypothetical protein
MTKCLFVVLGAGASYDSTSEENRGSHVVSSEQGSDRVISSRDLRPPLVTELFDPRFAGILNKYPLAQMAASDIRRRRHTPVAIEEFLRTQYRDSNNSLDQRKFHAVHWYLQDVLWCVSRFYTSHPDNYDRLVTGCLRLPRVVFITLNYDTLLDDRLRIVSPVDSLDAYTPPDENWGLIKLHGSVDWGRPIADSFFYNADVVYNTPTTIRVRDEIVLRRAVTSDIRDVRLQRDSDQWFYPAMSVPVGTRDEFSCPPEHIGYLRNVMASQSDLDILMLGYSALDEEVLRLFKASGKPLRSLMVVNADEKSARQASERVHAALGHPKGLDELYPQAFRDFVGSDDFDDYLALL